MEKHHHAGHRDRVRMRFLKEGGFDSFEDHQILEMLLFYAIPRRDTNELAHRMLTEFGDLDILINSEPEAIANRTGVSINTAILISMIGKIITRSRSRIKNNTDLKQTESAKKFFSDLLKDETVEKFYIACLNKNKRLIKLIKVSEGSSSQIFVKLSCTLADVMRLGAMYAICAHNHPSGTSHFSIDDIKATNKIKQYLSDHGITLMDHILVCGDKTVSMSEIKKYSF